MTQFVSVDDVATLFHGRGSDRFFRELTAVIGDDFRRWPVFEKAARLASHSRDGVIELMPTSDGETYGFKYVNGHPRNTLDGKLTVTAFGVLADVASGYPTFISEMTLLTAMRTAATSALAAKALARPESRRMALIGAGAQAEFQALAFRAVLGIDTVAVYDVDAAATDKFMRNLRGVPGLRILRAGSVAEAVAGADIVTTATAAKTRATILTPDMIEPGMHINAIGGDCPGKTELAAAILERAKVFVEFPPQSRIEGEIQQMGEGFAVTELWRVLTGEAKGRTSATDVTVFDSVGFAIEDFSTLRYVRDIAVEAKVGSDLDLVPAPRDPKDLFGVMGRRTNLHERRELEALEA